MLMWLIVALIKKNCILPYISHNISPIKKKDYWCCRRHQDWAMIQNLHFCYLYESGLLVQLKSADLLTIPLCPNLLYWIFYKKIFITFDTILVFYSRRDSQVIFLVKTAIVLWFEVGWYQYFQKIVNFGG